MAVPRLPSFDAKGFSTRLKALGEFAVFDQFVSWKKGVDGLRDNVAALDVQLNSVDGLKNHIDRLDAREASHHANQAQRLAAIEAQLTQSPFPG